MKKIPTLFEREFVDHQVVNTLNKVTPGMEWVLEGEGVATVKFDGSCCAVIDGKFYKRYDAKKNKNGVAKLPPPGSIPCCDPDPVTGHWPHWVEVSIKNHADRWFLEAYDNAKLKYPNGIPDGTYEAVGLHFQGNPYKLGFDTLLRHGDVKASLKSRTYEGIKKYLSTAPIEGIVFWKDGEPKCKIKRKDFGFPWPLDNC